MKHIFSISAGLIFIQINLHAMNFYEVQKFMRFMTQEAVFFELQERNKIDIPEAQELSAPNQVQPEKQPAKKDGAKTDSKKKKK